jgi:hypothetical protein
VAIDGQAQVQSLVTRTMAAAGAPGSSPGLGTRGEVALLSDTCPAVPTVEKIRAAFTVLRAFGSVSTGPRRGATRFAMVTSLDFSATGRVTAAQFQVRHW